MGLTLVSDAAFQIAFRDNTEGIGHLVRLVLQRDDIRIVKAEAQHRVQSIAGHSAVFDLLAEDSEGRRIDIEIQAVRGNRKELLLRALYYLSAMHVSSLGKGQPYGEMGESYVIFLADGNVFGDGRAIHEIRLTDEGNGIEEYRSAIYVADIAGYGKMETEWDKFCHDMHTAEIGRIVLSWMREAMYRVKGESRMIDTTMSLIEQLKEEGRLEGLERGLERGMEKGIEKGRTDIARNMLSTGRYQHAEIAGLTDLPLAEVEKLASQMGR